MPYGASFQERQLFFADHPAYFCVKQKGSGASGWGDSPGGGDTFPLARFETTMFSRAITPTQGEGCPWWDGGSGKSFASMPEPRRWSRPRAKHFGPYRRM